MLTCKRLRTAVLFSAFLLIAGVVLEALARFALSAIPTSHLALFLVLAAGALLALTFLASLLPGTSERLRECRH